MRDLAPPRPKLAPGVTASGQPLDSWPPPPPPQRSQLALPTLPPVKMPQPPAQPPPKVPAAAPECGPADTLLAPLQLQVLCFASHSLRLCVCVCA